MKGPWPQGARGQRLLVYGLAAVAIGVGLGLRDPWPADEPRFALIARDMVEQGSWLFPQRAGDLYPDKPPLFMWLIAAAYQCTGSLRIAFLLPSMLLGFLSVVLIEDLTRRLHGARAATTLGLFCLGTVQLIYQAKTAQIDATLCGFTTLGAYGLLRHLLLGPQWGWLFIGGLAMGCGIISKAVGFLPLAMLPAWLVLHLRGARLPTLRLCDVRWMLLPLGIALPLFAWLGPMLWAVHVGEDAALTAYRDNILFKQTAERYARSWHHLEPWYYYLVAVIPVLWLPLSALLPWLGPAWWHRLRRSDPRIILPLSGAVLIVLFFSISPGKRGVYLLPALPLVLLAAAPLLPPLLRRPTLKRGARWLLSGCAGLLVLASVLGPLLAASAIARIAERYALWIPPYLVVLAVAAATAAAWAWWRQQTWRPWLAFALVGWSVLGLGIWPDMNRERSGRGLMQRVDAVLPKGFRLGLTQWREQFVLHSPAPYQHWGYGRPWDEEQALAAAWLRAAPQRALLCTEEHLGAWSADFVVADCGWAHRRHWRLLTLPRSEETDAP